MATAAFPRSLYPHVHGVPSWTDLHTGDADGAGDFYAEVLGWTYRRQPTLRVVPERHGPAFGPGRAVREQFSMVAMSHGLPVAEFIEQAERNGSMGVPANWLASVYVNQLETALHRVEDLGGLVLRGPSDRRGGLARVAVILDPSGAVLGLWEPGALVGEPGLHKGGSLACIELETPHLDRARRFYTGLFGWDSHEVVDLDGGLGTHLVFSSCGQEVAAAVSCPLADVSASWCSVFNVADTDAAVQRAVAAGAVVLAEPADMALGRRSALVDPEGALFAVIGPTNPGPRLL